MLQRYYCIGGSPQGRPADAVASAAVSIPALADYLAGEYVEVGPTLWQGVLATSPRPASGSRIGSSGPTGPLLEAAVSKLVGSKRRVAVAMSGGVDSTVLAASLRRMEIPFEVVSVAFPDLPCDESAAVGRVARELGVSATFVDGRRVELLREEDWDLPIDPRFAAMRALGRHAADRGAELLLFGHGGDELFVAPRTIAVRACLRAGEWHRVRPIDLLRAAFGGLRSPAPEWWGPRVLERRAGRLPRWIRAVSDPHPIQSYARHWLDRAYVNASWTARAVSLVPTAFPLLEPGFVGAILEMPELGRTASEPFTKQALRAAGAPRAIQHHGAKTNLGSFLEWWLEERQPTLHRLLRASRLQALGLADTSPMWQAHARRKLSSSTIWLVLGAEAWLRRHLSS